MKKKIVFGVVLLCLVAGIVSLLHFDVPAAQVEKKYALPNSKFIDLSGLRVHYTDESDLKNAQDSEVVVLIHGTAASLHTWQGWITGLRKNFRVIRMDLPAFGLTGPAVDHNYSVDNYVRFLETFFAALKLKQIMLVGNSLGGQIAWHYAVKHGDNVNKLILIDSAGLPRVGAVPLPIRLARKPVLKTLARFISPRFLVKKSLLEVYFDDAKVTDTLVDRYYTMTLRTGNREAFVNRAEQLTDDNGAGLEKILSPTLVMWGRHDEWIPVAHAEEFRKKILLSRLKIYENAGHIPQEEIPDETLNDALRFLK